MYKYAATAKDKEGVVVIQKPMLAPRQSGLGVQPCKWLVIGVHHKSKSLEVASPDFQAIDQGK